MEVKIINGKVVEANVLITLLRFTKVANGRLLPLALIIMKQRKSV